MKVLIADDHEVVRRGVRQILTDAFGKVHVGQAVNAAQLLERLRREPWDLVLLDINMPGRSGLDALLEVHREQPKLPVLVLSIFSEQAYALRAFQVGAAGYLTKQSLGRELVAAIRKVLAGGRYITPAQAEMLAASLDRDGVTLPHLKLSNREFEIMKLLATGKSVKQIAHELWLGEKTVFTYRARLLQKLGVRGDVEVARYALRHHLVD